MKSMQELKEKLRLASERFRKCEIVPAGEYSFTVLEASLEHDDKRHYDYLYVRLDCDGKLTSDRFPFTDNMFWKLKEFLFDYDS
jgi:hypothetical protein